MSWASVAGAAVTAVGGYLATKKAKKKSAAEKQIEEQQLASSKYLVPYGQGMLDKSRAAFEQPLNFYSRLASGDRNSLLQQLSPELQSRDESDRAAMSSAAELGQRGGASSDFLSRLPFRRNTDTANALFGARRAGIEGMTGLATNMGSIGLNAVSGGQAGGMNLLNFGLNRNRQAFDQGSSTGEGIFQIAKAFADAYGSKGKSPDYSAGQWGQVTNNPLAWGRGSGF